MAKVKKKKNWEKLELLGQNCINTEAFLKASIYIQVCNLDMYLDPDWYQMIEESQVWPQ